MVDPEIVNDVSDLILLHQVRFEVDYSWGSESVPKCFMCAYLGDKEDPSLHTANIVLEYLESAGFTTTKGN